MKYKKDIIIVGLDGRPNFRVTAIDRPLLNVNAVCPGCKKQIRGDFVSDLVMGWLRDPPTVPWEIRCGCGWYPTAAYQQAARKHLAYLKETRPDFLRELLESLDYRDSN